MTKHTPGPWRWSQPVETYSEWQLGAEPDTVVMSVYMSHGGGEMPNEADARLIAAAPELLDQLKATLQALLEVQNEYGYLSDSQEATLEAAMQLYFRLVPEGV